MRTLTGLTALVAIAVALNILILKEHLSTASVLVPLGLGLVAAIVWVVLRVLSASAMLGRGKTSYGLNTLVSTAAFFGICVMLYAFALHWNREWDLTQEGRRELAPQTRQVLEALNEDVEVIGLFIRGGDTIMQASRDKTERFLAQAQALSPFLKVRFEDYEENPLVLQDLGLTEGRLSPQGTVVIRKGGKKRVLPLSGVTARLEERDFTNSLINVLRSAQPKVCFLTGHNERSIQSKDEGRGAISLKMFLEGEAYLTEEFKFSLMAPQIPEDCQVLVVNGPELPFRPEELQVIRDYLAKGGRALFLLDPLKAPMPLLPSWLYENYGITVGEDILFSSITEGEGQIYLLPDVGKITVNLKNRKMPEDFKTCYSQKHPITRGFDQEMMLSIVRSVGLASKLPEGVVGEEILRTLPFTYAETDLQLLLEKGIKKQDPDEPEGSKSVAVAVTAKTDRTAADSQQAQEARLVVVGDGDIASNQGLRYRGHLEFLLNTVAWLTEREELIAIRPTGTQDQPIVLTEGEEQLIAWVSTLGLLQMIALAGGVVYAVRRRYR